MREDRGRRWAQFVTLYRVFLTRVVDLDLLSKEADTTRVVAQFITVFAGISFALTAPVLLVGGGFAGAVAWTPEHFFIATTLLAVGGVSVMSWDAVMPERRDVLVLAPLPVRMSTLFAAKVSALFAAPLLAIVSLNVFSGVVWPLLFASHSGGFAHALRAWPAYWITMMGAGAFLFCALLTLQGLLQNILPRQIFLRLSSLMQAGVLCGLLCLYLLEPSLESTKALMDPANRRALSCLPAYWFLGMFQQLNGSMEREFVWLAWRAWTAVGMSVAGAVGAVLLSYFRLLPKIVEQPEIVPVVRSFGMPERLGGAVGGGLNQAIALFSLRTLTRSRQHRMIRSFYVGIGLAIVIAYGKTTPGDKGLRTGIPVTSLLASVLLMVLPVLALRVVAAMPIALKANWMVQLTQVRAEREYRRAARLSWMALTVLPAESAMGALLLWMYPRGPAWLHLALLLVLGWLMVEVCLATFPKVPFACSYLPGKANLHVIFWVVLFGVIGLLRKALEWESRLLQRPWWFAGAIGCIGLAASGMALMTELRSRKKDTLVFEEEYGEEIVTLNLRG